MFSSCRLPVNVQTEAKTPTSAPVGMSNSLAEMEKVCRLRLLLIGAKAAILSGPETICKSDNAKSSAGGHMLKMQQDLS